MLVNSSSAGMIGKISKYSSLGIKILVIVGAVVLGFMIISDYNNWQTAEKTAEKEQKELVLKGEIEAYDESQVALNDNVIQAKEALISSVHYAVVFTLVFVVIGLVITLLFGLGFLVANFKQNYKTVISFAALAVVLLIAKGMSSGTAEGINVPEEVDPSWVGVGETGIYASMILIGIAIVGSLAGFVVKLVK